MRLAPVLCGFVMCLVVACRRGDKGPTADRNTSISPVASATSKVEKASWKGKHLHVWTTSCDPKSRESNDVVALVSARNTSGARVDGVGVACTSIVDGGNLSTHDESPPGEGRAKIAARLGELGVVSTFVVANPGPEGFDGPLGARVLGDEAARGKLVNAILDVRAKERWRAIEIDLEALPTSAAQNLVTLVREVVRRAGPTVPVFVDVHPKTVDDPGWDGPGAHDYRALADAGAVLRLMTYDLSIGPVPPGPSTKASWIREVVAYARGKGVPPEKLEIGLPAYGYDFPPQGKGAAVALRHEEVLSLKKKKNVTPVRDELGTPHFTYAGTDGEHQVWYDDAESLARVLRDIEPIANDVRGIAIWGVGQSDPDLSRRLHDLGF